MTTMEATCGMCGAKFEGSCGYGWCDLRDLYKLWMGDHRCTTPEGSSA